MSDQTYDIKILPPTVNPVQIQPTRQAASMAMPEIESKTKVTNDVGNKKLSSGKPIHNASKPQVSGWLNWFRSTVNTLGSKVTEKARTSMDTMITTLDPQMKQYINTGGDIDLIVASNKTVKIVPLRESFQLIFGKANVSGVQGNASNVASQPVSVESALKSARERINNVRGSRTIHPQQPVVAVESFLIEMSFEHWFEMNLLLLDDPWHEIIIQMFTQAVPIPLDIIKDMKDGTADSYEHKESGFSVTIGEAISKAYKIPHTNWHEHLFGITRKHLLLQAGKSLAYVYRSKLPTNII